MGKLISSDQVTIKSSLTILDIMLIPRTWEGGVSHVKRNGQPQQRGLCVWQSQAGKTFLCSCN